jgi:hypothetical protein
MEVGHPELVVLQYKGSVKPGSTVSTSFSIYIKTMRQSSSFP